MGYKFSSLVKYSETDENELLTTSDVAGYFQDCMAFHDRFSGMGTQYWRDRGAMWVITSWSIAIKRRPGLAEKIEIGTQTTDFTKVRGYREFMMRDENGELIAMALGKFALISPDDGTPVKITQEEIDAYGKSEPLGIPEDKAKILVPEDAVFGNPIEISHHHIDGNHHVNNITYMRLALRNCPEGFDPKYIRMSYHRQSLLGDALIPHYGAGKHETTGALKRDEQVCCAFYFSDEIPKECLAVFDKENNK